MSGRKAGSNGIEPGSVQVSGRAWCDRHSDPSTGLPVGARVPYFLEVNHELLNKGFFVTATDDLITWARTGSLMRITLASPVAVG